MYLYLYAPFLRNKKYARELALLEGRVTDFGISGKVAQLSQFLKFPAAVKEFGVKRIKTLVLVGDDRLLEEAAAEFINSPVVLGYIPLGESVYAQALAIPQGAEAAEILAARRIAKLDMGRASERCFLGTVQCEGQGLEVHTPTFSIFPKGLARVQVVNLSADESGTDGLLSVHITPFERSLWSKKAGRSTVLKVQSCRLKAVRPLNIGCGASGVLKTPVQVDILPGAVRIVVGRRTVRRK